MMAFTVLKEKTMFLGILFVVVLSYAMTVAMLSDWFSGENIIIFVLMMCAHLLPLYQLK